ncbi:MAG: DUF2125 domain-containing protein [Pseudomonadota bacterium]
MLKQLLAVICAASLLWGGSWFWGQWTEKSALADWQEARRADGWQADWADLRVAGFPNRYDSSFTDLALADPATGWAWRAPFFQILRLRYQPTHLILVWPDTQTLQHPDQTLQIASDEMKASLVYGTGAVAPVERGTFVATNLTVAAGENWQSQLEELRLAATSDGDPRELRLGIEGSAIRITGLPVPDIAGTFRADLDARFDRTWDERALNDRRPQMERLQIRNIEAQLGQLNLRVAGTLTPDTDGRASGELLVKATNWRDVLDLAIASGAVPEELKGPITTGLELISRLAGHPETLDIPIAFRGGKTRLGPLPLGPAPLLQIP